MLYAYIANRRLIVSREVFLDVRQMQTADPQTRRLADLQTQHTGLSQHDNDDMTCCGMAEVASTITFKIRQLCIQPFNCDVEAGQHVACC